MRLNGGDLAEGSNKVPGWIERKDPVRHAGRSGRHLALFNSTRKLSLVPHSRVVVLARSLLRLWWCGNRTGLYTHESLGLMLFPFTKVTFLFAKELSLVKSLADRSISRLEIPRHDILPGKCAADANPLPSEHFFG